MASVCVWRRKKLHQGSTHELEEEGGQHVCELAREEGKLSLGDHFISLTAALKSRCSKGAVASYN